VHVHSSILCALKPNHSSASKLSILKREVDGKFDAYVNDIKVDLNDRVAEKMIRKIQTAL
jgi:hypothetical protein